MATNPQKKNTIKEIPSLRNALLDKYNVPDLDLSRQLAEPPAILQTYADFRAYLDTKQQGAALSINAEKLIGICFKMLDANISSYRVILATDGFENLTKTQMDSVLSSAFQFFEKRVQNYWVGRSWISGHEMFNLYVNATTGKSHGHRRRVKR